MENEMLKEILLNVRNIGSRLDHIEEHQSCFSKEFGTFHKEQTAFNKEQLSFREEFNAFRKEQSAFNKEQLSFREEFNAFRKEQTAFNKEQLSFREEFNAFRKEQTAFNKEQLSFREEFNAFRKEQSAFNSKVLKELSDLRTDVDTIYELEMDTRKTVKSHTEILNKHSEQLEQLIKLANVNQEQHEDFDKRISFLESIVS